MRRKWFPIVRKMLLYKKWLLCETRFSCSGKLRSNARILISNLAESVIMTNRLNLVQDLPGPCKYFDFTRFLYKIYFK